ncbi:HU family DNA-binding protein [Phocaeicola coprocola]|uniref:HU family DNA-binding protein n=1 Tax=Phocaeicola coprocola TaxID=310298 RepID=UPI00195C2D30|nr:HU family DNA-binding protein [Phocaeicola coprocola]MBM6903574.1 HU family DNA-binding protein [Phocaeicola coprocola]
MPILFDFYVSPSDSGKGEKEKYHARVVRSHTVQIDDIVNNISKRCTLSKGDIRAVLDELGDEIVYNLCEGNRVYLPGIGYFYLSLSTPKEADPKTTRSQSIGIKAVEFRADSILKNNLESHARFERSDIKVHSSRLDSYEIDALLEDYFHKNDFLTRIKFEKLCGFTKTTAQRHLQRLMDEGRLVNVNTRHNPIYKPAKGFYGNV